MPVITRALLRKRAEHNEGMISTLEEISLHQEELESINEVLGMTCRKLKILYLQNNIIPKMENLSHLKELRYLNLALNNISKIEGLHNCEHLNKLDLTDVDELEDSINELVPLINLHDLYMMGNPCQSNWTDFNSYVIAKLPQLHTLDGTEITRSMQIIAKQKLSTMEEKLRIIAFEKRIEKELLKANKKDKLQKDNNEVNNECAEVDDNENETPELTDNTPEARVEIYKELAEQKKEKADREAANAPRQRDYEKEQAEALAAIRKKEEENGEREIKQKNEGGWGFRWDEESKQGYVILDVEIARHLDSSLIDVDIHPTYISIVIKSKVLRLRLPAEVKVTESKCQRSKTTGSLQVIMPKVNPKENAITIRGDVRYKNLTSKDDSNKTIFISTDTSIQDKTRTIVRKPKQLSMQEQLLAEAQAIRNSSLEISSSSSSNVVNIQNIVKHKESNESSLLINIENNNGIKNKKITEI